MYWKPTLIWLPMKRSSRRMCMGHFTFFVRVNRNVIASEWVQCNMLFVCVGLCARCLHMWRSDPWGLAITSKWHNQSRWMTASRPECFELSADPAQSRLEGNYEMSNGFPLCCSYSLLFSHNLRVCVDYWLCLHIWRRLMQRWNVFFVYSLGLRLKCHPYCAQLLTRAHSALVKK